MSDRLRLLALDAALVAGVTLVLLPIALWVHLGVALIVAGLLVLHVVRLSVRSLGAKLEPLALIPVKPHQVSIPKDFLRDMGRGVDR